jgi:hypothetical protein
MTLDLSNHDTSAANLPGQDNADDIKLQINQAADLFKG